MTMPERTGRTAGHAGAARDGFASFAELYARGDYAGFPQEHRAGGSFGLNLLDVRQDAIETTDPAVPDVVFASVLKAEGPGDLHFGDGWRRVQRPQGTVHVVPAYLDVGLRTPALHLRGVSLPHATLASRLDEVGLSTAALDAVAGDLAPRPEAARLIDLAWGASERGGAASRLLVDGAFTALVGALLADGGETRLRAPVPAVGDRRIARVIDYVEAHLEEPIDLADLAGVAAISVFHFSRVFRAATGQTPHRYVQARRVERAKAMLTDPALPLAQAAFACGFASQSHFGQVFRAHTGMTPGEWRAGAMG